MSEGDLYFYDPAAADRVVRFIETCLVHVEGRHFGQPFILLDWQRKILREIFGTLRRDNGFRRYREAYIECPRKQGKSALASAVGLYLTVEGEKGGQVYSVAVSTEQASITFDTAKKMCANSPALRKRITPYRYHLEHAASGSRYKVLSGESAGSHGKSVHGLIADELHEWTSKSSRDLFEALVSSRGHRTQPLTFIVTTAGHGGAETLWSQYHAKALQYVAGECDDPEFFAAVWAAPQNADWKDPAVWRACNPSLGETVDESYLAAECVKAQQSPAYENTFRRLYLCQPTEQATRWLSLDRYKAVTAPIDLEALEGQPVYLGVDLSQSFDLAAVAMIFPQADRWQAACRIYMPMETARRRQRDEGTPFLSWIDAGHIVGTEGPTVDYDRIEADIHELAGRYEIREVAFDPYNANSLTNHLDQAGIITVPVFQSFLAMSAACKELERRIVAGQIAIDSNPALAWTAANVEVESDRHGNIRPTKPASRGKYAGGRKYSIDPIVALIIATSRAMLRDTDGGDFDAISAIAFA